MSQLSSGSDGSFDAEDLQQAQTLFRAYLHKVLLDHVLPVVPDGKHTRLRAHVAKVGGVEVLYYGITSDYQSFIS